MSIPKNPLEKEACDVMVNFTKKEILIKTIFYANQG
jgi:hypothetical protein